MPELYFGDTKPNPLTSSPNTYPGSGVEGVFRSRNNLLKNDNLSFGGISYRESCQASSAMWCSHVLNEGPETNPHDSTYDYQLIKSHTKRLVRNGSFVTMGPQIRSDIEILGEMETLLGWVGITNTRRIGVKSRDDMLKYVVACENPCLIWMQTHMVGAYAENHEKIYFYDNTIGLAICKGMKSLKSWVEWVCDHNGEIVVWNDPKKQVTWKGIECLG